MAPKQRKFRCCICGKQIAGYGNNPIPVKPSGECCDRCNAERVLPARYKLAKRYQAL